MWFPRLRKASRHSKPPALSEVGGLLLLIAWMLVMPESVQALCQYIDRFVVKFPQFDSALQQCRLCHTNSPSRQINCPAGTGGVRNGYGEDFRTQAIARSGVQFNFPQAAVDGALDDISDIPRCNTIVPNCDSDGDGFSNAVEITAGSFPGDLNNRPPADLFLSKSAAPNPVLVGRQLTYTLTVVNLGPNEARNVTVTDTLRVAANSVTPSQGSCSGTTNLTCFLGTLLSSATATITIDITPTTDGPLDNSANVTGFGFLSVLPDPQPLNNNAQTTTTVNRVADLAITKADQPDPVIVGNNITYELTVTNKGPSPANNMVVTDTLPSGVIFVAATSSQGICTRAGSIVTCNLPGPLALNAQATVRIIVTSTRVDPRLTNTATVTSSVTDLDMSNNLATADTMVIPLPPTGAELVITMQDSSDPAIVGSPLTYTITVLNSGPDSATDVVVTDTLPASATFNSASPSQGNCVQTSGTVTCNLGTMARNGQAIIPLTVTPRVAGIITNKTSVTSTAANDNPANNSAEERTVVNEADSDLDGINDAVEDGAPNSGDGNRDGIADRLQENVSSLPNGVDGSYVTLFSPATTRLVDVRAVENSSPADAPPRVEFPVGFFAFAVQGVVPGGTITLTLFLPSGVEVDTYYKFGPTPDDPSDHWYEFLFDGTTGAEILADRVILHFVDGQRGDDDLSANGAVMEPGAPARQTGVDLALSISNTPNPMKVGQTLTYTGVVTNNGPEVAT